MAPSTPGVVMVLFAVVWVVVEAVAMAIIDASQHSELVQLLSAQLEVGSDAFTVKTASHELCWKLDDEHEGLASQHSVSVQSTAAQKI